MGSDSSKSKASGAAGAATSAPQSKQETRRPPTLDLKHDAAWPQLSLESEARAAAAALAERSSSKLRVLTWNVWFDQFFASLRQQALMKELLAAAPDVACLQEVLPGFAEVLRGNAALCEVYDISPQSVAPYGCLMLVRRDLRPQFGLEEFPTIMGRSLLFAECQDSSPGLFVATVHLESLNSAATRKQQLQVAARVLRRRPLSIICGDFNFDDTQTWGDWRRKAPALSLDEVENNVLQQVLPSFCDTWRAVHPHEPGKTFDGMANPICVPDPHEQMRYDRLLASTDGGLKPTSAVMLGTADIEGATEGLKPSDHFGLLVDLEISPCSF
mmetsp:Transcript_51511/g.159763  ORF Transcript_51511/g.159763 Transcript_51511/m.159763 type:complete len:329 (-) Transcript_51511:166-1152(-)